MCQPYIACMRSSLLGTRENDCDNVFVPGCWKTKSRGEKDSHTWPRYEQEGPSQNASSGWWEDLAASNLAIIVYT